MGVFDHAGVGCPKGPSEGKRAGHSIVGQDRHQMMRRFSKVGEPLSGLSVFSPRDGALTYFSKK